MTRGNQRDKDRERAQKRAAAAAPKKGTKGDKNEGQSLKNKMESNAEIMRAKQQAAQAKAALAAGGPSKK